MRSPMNFDNDARAAASMQLAFQVKPHAAAPIFVSSIG